MWGAVMARCCVRYAVALAATPVQGAATPQARKVYAIAVRGGTMLHLLDALLLTGHPVVECSCLWRSFPMQTGRLAVGT